MVSFKNVLLLAATASALVIQDRDVNTVLSNLKKIDSATNTLTSDTKAWDGSIGGSLKIQNDEGAIEDATEAATSEANGEKQASSADSKTILTYVTGTLTPDIKSALNEIVARKSDFSKSGLSGLVKSDLTKLKSDSDSLGAALKKVASSDQQSAAQSAIDAIDAAFNSALGNF